MKLKFKVLTLLLIMTMLVGIIVGCSKDADDTQGEDSQNIDNESVDEQITLSIIDWSDGSASFRKEFHEEYMKNNPNIKIEYTQLTMDQFKTSIVTSIKSGDAPDLFPVPSGMSLTSVVNENWYQPMNDLIPEEFWDTLVDGTLQEGITMVDENIYAIPEVQYINNSLIFYNKDILEAAGVTELPTTYSEFRDANKKVTEAGNGAFFGYIEGGKQLGRLDVLVRAFANVGGAKIAQLNNVLTNNGRANYDSQAVKDAFELFTQIYKDGSIHPDTVNISAPEAREYFAQGQAAFLMQGSWCITQWEESNPELNFGVMSVPTPDSGAKGAIPAALSEPWMGIYSQSKHPEVAADYLMALYNYSEDDYHYQEDLTAKGAQLSIVNGIVDEYLTNPLLVEYYETYKETSIDIPVATYRDSKVYDFYAEVVDVQPSLSALFQGVISGSLDDYESALETLAEGSTKEWKRAAEEVDIDFSVFEFENWDPMIPYASNDYAELE